MDFFKNKISKCFLTCVIMMCFSSATVAQDNQSRKQIYVVSFNVLAPCWASPKYYPSGVAPYLDRVLRRSHIMSFLNSVAPKADIIALQETTQTEFEYFKEDLQNDFYAFQAYHDPSYWSNWITPGIPWEPNGVAIFVKKSTFTNVSFLDKPLTEDGNHSAYFEGIVQSTGKKVRAVSIHLDNDHGYNRHYELKALLQFLTKESVNPDIIAGDFNFGTEGGVIKRLLDNNHFVDVLHYLGREEWTHPFDVEGDRNSGIIDHIAVRNATPIDGHVLNFGLWKLYPHDQTGRVIANLEISGSDHFPILGVVS